MLEDGEEDRRIEYEWGEIRFGTEIGEFGVGGDSARENHEMERELHEFSRGHRERKAGCVPRRQGMGVPSLPGVRSISGRGWGQ